MKPVKFSLVEKVIKIKRNIVRIIKKFKVSNKNVNNLRTTLLTFEK